MAPVAARRAPPQAAPPNRPYLLVRFLLIVLSDFVFFADAFGWTRSGSTFLPVERFHSSYWSSVILPSTSSCANFRRCALLLKGILKRLANAKYGVSLARWSLRGSPAPQLTAFFTSAPILASSAAVNFVRAKAIGHMFPSSSFALSLKPNVAYLVLNFCALWKKQTTLPSLA